MTYGRPENNERRTMGKIIKFQKGKYPENFIRRLLDDESAEISQDQIDGFLSIYKKIFDEPKFFHYEDDIRRRYQSLIEMLYEKRCQIKYVANFYRVSRNRITQLEARIVAIFIMINVRGLVSAEIRPTTCCILVKSSLSLLKLSISSIPAWRP